MMDASMVVICDCLGIKTRLQVTSHTMLSKQFTVGDKNTTSAADKLNVTNSC